MKHQLNNAGNVPIPVIDPDKCQGCGECVSWCPGKAVELINGKATIKHAENCSYCTECETICPTGAISCPFEIILSPQP